MKQIFYKKWMQILAGILCILSFNIMGASFMGICCLEQMNIYNRDKADILQQANLDALRNYSILALSEYRDDFNMEELKDTKFRYGVIKASQIDDLDLNDRSIYKVCNFEKDKVIDRDEINKSINVYSCTIGNDTDIHVGKSILDDGYVSNSGSFTVSSESVSYVIDKIYYTSDTNHFYYMTQKDNGAIYIYPAKSEIGQSETGTAASEFIVPVEESGDTAPGYQWMRDDIRMRIEGEVTRYLADIEITTYPRLDEMGIVVSRDTDYECGDGVINTWEETENYDRPAGKPYFVISYMGGEETGREIVLTTSPLTLIANWNRMDYFAQAASLVEIACRFRYTIYGLFLLALAFFGVTFCISIVGAGHKNGGVEVSGGILQKIPYDVFLALAAAVEIFFICLAMAFISEIDYLHRALMLFAIIALLPGEILAYVIAKDFAVRVKTKNLFKNTLCYKCVIEIKSGICRGIKACSKALPMLWKAWLIMGALALIELFFMAGFVSGDILFLWFVEKAAVYFFLTLCLIQMDKLQKAAQQIASGEEESLVNTEKMWWEFKRHGENLNKIREGINSAVEQKIKSERFKTELITNVSHDIKTPLTSIINYVDLLEKEEFDNSKARGYLEVLSRQSARLKKLIEDLMEASKASTGNISLSLEPCDVKILLTQMIGEFEEKLNGSHIELIVQGSTEDMKIPADTRHLYRVFENLMNNICKYALESTRAYVNVEQREKKCVIIFRNISRFPLNIGSEELMERFVRGDGSRNTEGSGLGLSIAKSLTELMGGSFELVVDGDLFKVMLYFPIITKTL